MSVNRVILLGNVGKDPEIRSTQTGKEIANLTIATSEHWKDKTTGERKERTEWHRIVIFNEWLVGLVKSSVKKGSKLYIEGSLQTRKWQDKSGKDCYSTEVVLQGFGSTLQLLDKREDNAQEAHTEAKGTAYVEGLDESIPDFDQDVGELDVHIPF